MHKNIFLYVFLKTVLLQQDHENEKNKVEFFRIVYICPIN